MASLPTWSSLALYIKSLASLNIFSTFIWFLSNTLFLFLTILWFIVKFDVNFIDCASHIIKFLFKFIWTNYFVLPCSRWQCLQWMLFKLLVQVWRIIFLSVNLAKCFSHCRCHNFLVIYWLHRYFLLIFNSYCFFAFFICDVHRL